MILSLDLGWHILPINGNPFRCNHIDYGIWDCEKALEECNETLEDLVKYNPAKFDGQYYLGMKCQIQEIKRLR